MIAVTLAAAGCKRGAGAAGDAGGGAAASALPPIVVKAGRKLLYTYARPDGTFATTDDPATIPAAARGWVRVVDLATPPDRRRDLELVYVADLRRPGDGGRYPYVVMSRRAFEANAVARARPGATAPAPAPRAGKGGARVVVYGTSWCGACRAARRFLRERGVAFEDRDIEADPAAARELMAKARAAGISASGVPVIDVGGTLMQGFDATRLGALLQAAGL